MVNKANLRQIQVTKGSLKNSYLRVQSIIDFFPIDVRGGKSKASSGTKFRVLTDNGRKFETDISAKGSFRNRADDGVRGFYRDRFHVGDAVFIYRIGKYEYFISKTMKAIEDRYGKSSKAVEVDDVQEGFEEKVHKEGAERRVVMTTRERNPELRKEAIEHYGRKCMVCEFSFDEEYGHDVSDGYIEVHHEALLAQSKGERESTVKDVKVVCSNCHRMIHRKKEMLDWKKLKAIVKKRRSQRNN